VVMEPASRARMLNLRTSSSCWQPGLAPQVALTAVVSEPASQARMLMTRTRSARGQPGPAPQVMGRHPPLPLHVALRASCPWAASCRRALELYTLALSTQVALAAVVSEPASQARMLRTQTRSARGQPGPTGHGSPSSVSSA
jgi:hypothetical protein